MKHGATLFMLILAAGCARAAPPATEPAADSSATERYVVADVLTDPAIDNAEQRFFQNDPRFAGRLVTIAADRVEIDDGTGACTTVRRQVTRQTPAQALAAELSRRGAHQPRHPTPADLKLNAGSSPVDVTRYTCTGEVPPGRIWTGAASFALPDGRIALIWEDEVVLVLAPAPEKIAPSFDCARAASQSEKAICADVGLSSWDRSVAAALVMARDGTEERAAAEDPDALADAQRAWIGERDACGGDGECLRDRMAERVAALLGRT